MLDSRWLFHLRNPLRDLCWLPIDVCVRVYAISSRDKAKRIFQQLKVHIRSLLSLSAQY